MPDRDRASAMRERMAYEAARIMVEQGLSDFDRARRKAAARTGIRDRRHWPTNEAVQEVVLVQCRLFLGREQTHAVRERRRAALHAMRAFEAFTPRLIGSTLAGTADRQAAVELFLFADRPEDVLFTLLDQGIPWHEGERTLRYRRGQRGAHPVFRFMAGDLPFELIVLPWQALRNPPLDPITERPWLGVALQEVEHLLAADDDPPGLREGAR